MTDATKLLVSCDELSAHLDDPAWAIFDTRHDLTDPGYGTHAYAEGHIPGAIFLHLDDDLSAPKTGSNGRHPLPDRNAFANKMAALGVARNTRCVVYDDAGGAYAGRAWWMLRWIGVESVALLDGGFPAWLAARAPISTAAPAPRTPAPCISCAQQDDAMTVDSNFVLAHLGDAATQLVDARAPARYRGEIEPLDPVAGHIPGAMNRFFQSNLNPDGTFRKDAELRTQFLSLLGGRGAAQVVHQCGSGVTACHNIFAMELAGLPGSLLYPGSWSEWVADRSRPVATGAA